MPTDKACVIFIVLGLGMASNVAEGKNPSTTAVDERAVKRLADEVHGQGWIAFSARSEKGDWDIFLCRPDGSHLRNITQTPEYNEFSPQFSRDGRRLLYRRIPRNEAIDNNHHGTQGELVFANSDGTDPKTFGGTGQYPWASWGPDGKQIACLSIKGISFVDVATRQVVRRLDRKGFFQQLTWSPDGKWLCGVANAYGTSWSIARMDAATGTGNAVNRVNCCTPDWFPDSRSVIFSWRPRGQTANKGYGWTQLWMADAEGKSCRLLLARMGGTYTAGMSHRTESTRFFTGNIEENGDQAMPAPDGPDAAEQRAADRRGKPGVAQTASQGWRRASADAPRGLGTLLDPQRTPGGKASEGQMLQGVRGKPS